MATWKCEKCGSEKSGMIQETLIEIIDDSGKYCKLKVCPKCAEEHQSQITDEYINRLSDLREHASNNKCIRCGKSIDDDAGSYCDVCRTVAEHLEKATLSCPHCGNNEFALVDDKPLQQRSRDDLLARCEQHLRVIKGILIAGAAYLIVKELIVLFIALSK